VNYVLFESKPPPEGDRAPQVDLARELARLPRVATLVLIQDGVFWTTARRALLEELAGRDGVEVLVDRFSLEVRGLADLPLPRGLSACELSEVVGRLARLPVKAVWH
jgi:sulfur transfer complex TusBCD TusB component (DsrH family)